MKIQNLSIIFLVIMIPLILILSYYVNLQRNTLKRQAEYDIELSEATKEGIRAFEVNTVDWTAYNNERAQATAMFNAFITSLANKLNVSGTAKEFMVNYIPALAVTMYNGYYIYSPSYVPKNWENREGIQLYLKYGTTSEITDKQTYTDASGIEHENEPLYIAKSTTGAGIFNATYNKEVEDSATGIISIAYSDNKNVTLDSAQAEMEYKYILNSKIAYSDQYVSNTINLVANYTLDNGLQVYGLDRTKNEYIEKKGYLVYFEGNTQLPRITINGEKIEDVNVEHGILNTIYSTKDTKGNTYQTVIEPEILTEQIAFTDNFGATYELETFKYVYDIEHRKLYYDDSGHFFRLNDNYEREYLVDDNTIKAGAPGCYYKSISLLLGNGKTTEYKKIYQVLNGKDKGKWYINLKPDDTLSTGKTEQIDTEVEYRLNELNLKPFTTTAGENIDYSAIYKDYSAISYYVEAYAFTNWINSLELKLSGETVSRTLKIDENNNPEHELSPIAQRKREVIKENINKNLSLAIANYAGPATGQFKLPVLSESDWDKIFSNISLISFFQGAPCGLKKYNGYSIATSTTNRAYVDPGELYFRADGDENYHRVYCKETDNLTYTGYRGV